MSNQTNEEKLTELKDKLKKLKAMLPEHCAGTEAFISTHRASTDHWLKIEEVEEEIKTLEAEIAG